MEISKTTNNSQTREYNPNLSRSHSSLPSSQATSGSSSQVLFCVPGRRNQTLLIQEPFFKCKEREERDSEKGCVKSRILTTAATLAHIKSHTKKPLLALSFTTVHRRTPVSLNVLDESVEIIRFIKSQSSSTSLFNIPC